MAIRRVFSEYRSRCRRRAIEWALSFEVFYSLVVDVCAVCGKKPINKYSRPDRVNTKCYYNGIDRIDNSLGYIPTNVRPCCKLCNSMKSNLKDKVFKKHVIRMAQKMAERKTTRRRS